MSADIITGKGAAFFIGALEVSVDEVNVEPETEDIKDKSSTALGRVRHAGGFSTTKMSLKGYWDPTRQPHDAVARNLRSGVKLSGVRWELIKASPTMRYLAQSVVVESVKVTDVAEKRAEIDVSFVVDGVLIYPGES